MKNVQDKTLDTLVEFPFKEELAAIVEDSWVNTQDNYLEKSKITSATLWTIAIL